MLDNVRNMMIPNYYEFIMSSLYMEEKVHDFRKGREERDDRLIAYMAKLAGDWLGYVHKKNMRTIG